MNFLSQRACLYEENNIRYQFFSQEFYEQTLECIIQSRTEQGTIYADFSFDRETIIKSSEEFLKNAVIRIIAIDISKESPIVVGQILGDDFTVFERSQRINSTNKKINVLKQINRKLILPLSNMKCKYGDIIIGSGFGVKKSYQNMNIGQILSQLFSIACLKSSYKIFCGLFYSRKAAQINCKNGGYLMSELAVEDCLNIDENLASYMKNGVQIIGYIDTQKECSHLIMPQNNSIQPSL